MGTGMTPSLKRAGIVSVVAVIGSIAVAAVLLPLLGAAFDTTSLVMCIVCPSVIAFPISLRTFRQAEALRKAHEALMRAHADLAEAHAQLAHKARLDQMTGMLNREAFFAAIRDARVDPQAGALLIIDADHFKRINDEHGHLTGDAALLKIAAGIARGVRPGDILGRIGGEEFAAFLPALGELEASVVAEQIRREVEAIAFSVSAGRRLPLTVSIGGVAAPRGAALADLMRAADRSLYEAKRRGRNRVVFAEEPAAVVAA